MPPYVELSRYRKSQPRSKIILTPTAVAPLPFTVVAVVKEQSGIQDPGPRAGPPGAGSCCPTLNAKEQCFNQAFARLQEVDSASGTKWVKAVPSWGRRSRQISCAMCQAQPAIGGGSLSLTSHTTPIPDPPALASLVEASNVVPFVPYPKRPVREARFS
jgi:hypothetical protein